MVSKVRLSDGKIAADLFIYVDESEIDRRIGKIVSEG